MHFQRLPFQTDFELDSGPQDFVTIMHARRHKKESAKGMTNTREIGHERQSKNTIKTQESVNRKGTLDLMENSKCGEYKARGGVDKSCLNLVVK